MDFVSNDIKTDGVIKIRIDAVGGNLDVVAARYPLSFMNEMARQLTPAIEAATGVVGIADSSVELVMMFASGTYMEHVSGNVTYRRLSLIDAVSAPRDFWVKWTRLEATDGEYTAENILFELGEDVDQKIREREYKYLLASHSEKYHSAMGRKKVTEWREVIKRAVKRGELIKPENDLELEPETLALEERIAGILGKTVEHKPEPERAEPSVTEPVAEDDEFAMAMEKARLFVEGDTDEDDVEDELLPDNASETCDDEDEIEEDPIPAPIDSDGDESEDEEFSFELDGDEDEELDADEDAYEDEPDGVDIFADIDDEPESCDDENEEDGEFVIEGEVEEELPEEFLMDGSDNSDEVDIFDNGEDPVDESEDEESDEEDLEDEESEPELVVEEIEFDFDLPDGDGAEDEDNAESEEEALSEPDAEDEPEEMIADAPAEDDAEDEMVDESEDDGENYAEAESENVASDDEAVDAPAPAVAEKNEAEKPEPVTDGGIVDRIADIRAQIETKIRLEYEIRAREKAEDELRELRIRLQRLQTESEITIAELRSENERLHADYDRLLEQIESERFARESEAARLRLEEKQLRDQIEKQLRAEAAERERLEESARIAIEEQRRLEAENARIARERDEEARAEAERLRREDQERELAEVRRAELERIRREQAEKEARARAAMPDMGDGNYTYTTKVVKFVFCKSVDPNITTRIYQLIKTTVDYYGKDGINLRIRASIPDTRTVILEFVNIPMEEMPLLGNIIKVLGKSGLGIVKAIIE